MFWKKKSNAGGDKVTIFFATDLHGSEVCYKKFINAAKFYGANVLVLGGDMTGKAVVPVTEQTDGTYRGHSHGNEVIMRTPDEVDEFTKRISNMGFYPAVMTEAEYQRLKDDEDGRQALFTDLVLARVREWCDYAGQKLDGSGVALITHPGNDDFVAIDDIMRDSPHVRFHEMEVTELHGYEWLHCGGSTPTPWNTEREFSDEEYAGRFEQLVPRVKDMSRCIFNVHVPPFGTVLDRCPKLDDNLQVVFEMGNPVSMHAGSAALYGTIEKHQPLLGLHGHIHEGRGNIKIGSTVCVNPGSVYPEGILQGVLVTLEGGVVRSLQLTQG